MIAPPPEAQADLLRLRTDFAFFARKCLFIRTKSGELVPLVLNKAQKHLHERLEAQRARGKVRAIIVKGRQLGHQHLPTGPLLLAALADNQGAAGVHPDPQRRRYVQPVRHGPALP